MLSSHRGEAGIVYCISRKDVDQTAAALADAGHKAVAYHAGLSDDERARNQDAFIDERADVVVATVAFGMGVDRSDVRFVVHAGAPKSLEHYQQEAGRAGRDGLAAECLLLYSSADFLKWRRIMELSGELSEADIAHLRQMERYAGAFQCRHKTLVEHFGQTYEGGDCGACDVCLGEIERVDDPLILAQKIGSCVARVKQRFGLVHVAAVLEGKSTPQIAQNGHDALSTFGLLKDLSAAEIKGYIEQLVARGFLQRTPGDYPVLELTADGRRHAQGPGRRRGHRAVPAAQGVHAIAVTERTRRCGHGPGRARVVGGRRSRPVRRASSAAPRDRARPRRAALRRLPRQHAARDGQGQAAVAVGAAARARRRRPQGRGLRPAVPGRHRHATAG